MQNISNYRHLSIPKHIIIVQIKHNSIYSMVDEFTVVKVIGSTSMGYLFAGLSATADN